MFENSEKSLVDEVTLTVTGKVDGHYCYRLTMSSTEAAGSIFLH